MDNQKRTEIDEKIAALQAAKNKWTHVTFAERIQLLDKILSNCKKYQREWVEVVLKERKLSSNQADDELSGGFLPVVRLCRLLIETMKPAAAAEKANKAIEFARPPSVKKVNGQTVVTVFPWGRLEGLLMPGITAEIWIQPGHELEQGTELRATYKQDKGQVSLILGAGNQNSIPIEDAFFKLFNQNQVVILKYNPVNDYIKPLVEKILQPLIQNNYFHHVSGGAEEAQYIIERVDNVHITGSARTHDLIVWGTDDPTKKKGQPKLKKEISSELGCVTPFIVVPGNWTEAQLQWQAENIAGAVTHNNSYNCTAAKVLVTCKNWELRKTLLNKVKEILKKVPARYAYYAGSEERYKKFMEHYPNAEVLECPKSQHSPSIPWTIIEDVPAREGEYALTVEPFCPVLSEVSLDAYDAVDFLQKAVPFCNEKIWGNLSCTLIVDPVNHKNHSKEVEKAIKDLKYGTVALNIWTSFGYFAGTCPWGAYPGNPLHDISSGRGFVHNSFFVDHIEKCVIRAPMTLIMGTRLPYFPTNRNGVAAVEAFIDWEANPSLWNTLKFLYQALRG